MGVEVTAPVVTKTAVAPVVSYGYPYAYNTHFLAKREAEADPLTVFPAVPAVSAVPAVPAVSTVYKTPVVSATHGYSLGNTYTYGHNAAFLQRLPLQHLQRPLLLNHNHKKKGYQKIKTNDAQNQCACLQENKMILKLQTV